MQNAGRSKKVSNRPPPLMLNGIEFITAMLVIIGLVALLYLKFYEYRSFCFSSSLLPPSNEIDQSVLNLYRQQIDERKQYLQQVPNKQDYYELYNILVPEVFCRDLIRVGFIGDGGKWICNPLRIQSLPNCVIYSLGTYNEISFEESFQKFTQNKCLLRALDKEAQKEETMKTIAAANGSFMKALIAGRTNESENQYIFKDVLKKFGDTRVDILKIDIEGAEFAVQDELVSVPICQILIEIHGNTARQTLQLLQKFSRNGFYLFSYEINGRWHTASEYSFIHQDCFEDYGIRTIYGKYLS